MDNLAIAKILNNIADILELQEVQWKPQAYRKVAMSIESAEDINGIYDEKGLKGLLEIPGVGKHIGEKIAEIIETGKLKYYESLKKKVKVDIETLNSIPGLGPKKIKLLYKKLNIKNLGDLEKAIKKEKLTGLTGFGEKTERILKEGIEFVKSKPNRLLYAHALPIVDRIRKEMAPFVKRFTVAGSFARGKETIGDLDFLAVSNKPTQVIDAFVGLSDVKDVIAKGKTKSSIRLSSGLQIDLRVVSDKQFGSAMNYFTGSKEHNVALRKLALSKGYTLSEYGLFRKKDEKWVAGKTESDIYKKLGLKYIEPELRENTGEIMAAKSAALPKLVTSKDVNGMFHIHTNWSDGNNSLLEMAERAEELKWKFISFTDHFGTMGIAHPLNAKRLVKYVAEIEKVRKRVGIRVFSGIEIDIMKDGSLHLSKKKLKELDVVIASVHMATRMSESEMTKRVEKALQNPINILGHPTDRLLNERPPIRIKMDRMFRLAKDSGVFLEINGAARRMDLNGASVKAGLKMGCKFALSMDAHSLDSMQKSYGVLMARRGWAEKKDILNCWSIPKIERALER